MDKKDKDKKKPQKVGDRGILVGAIGSSRLYFLPDATDPLEPNGAIAKPTGRVDFVDFARAASETRLLKKFTTSPFHEFLWGSHSGEKLDMWRSIFIDRTKTVPDEMLEGIDVRDNFSRGARKKASVDRKASSFDQRQKQKFDPSRLGNRYSTKSLGRTIRMGATTMAFDPNAYDADNDGFVQDATPWMRPAIPKFSIGSRSSTSAVLPEVEPDYLKGLPESLRKLISPDEVRKIISLTEEAWQAGASARRMNVKIDQFNGFGAPYMIQIKDINPKTGKPSVISHIGTPELMEVEAHAHRVGMQLVELIRKRIDLDGLQEKRQAKIIEISAKLDSIGATRAKAANQIGVRYAEHPSKGIVPRTRISRADVPKDPELKKIHADIIARLELSDMEEKQLNSALTIANQDRMIADLAGDRQRKAIAKRVLKDIESRLAEWRRKRDALYDEYSLAVTEVHERVALEIGGDEYKKIWLESQSLIDELMTIPQTRRQVVDEMLSIFREMGIEFGGEDIKFRLPTRDATEEDKAFVAAARELAGHADDVASRFLPVNLIRQLNKFNRTNHGLKVVKVDKRSAHQGSWNSQAKILETDGSEATTLHELIHAVADSNTYLLVLQQLILGARWLGHKDEKSRKKKLSTILEQGWDEPKVASVGGEDGVRLVEDKFLDLYAGRVYPSSAAETMTRAFDYLLDPTFDGTSQSIDYDLVASLFGGLLVATLGEMIQ